MSVAQQLTVSSPSAPRRFASEAAIEECKTFREAVLLAWECRSRPAMSQRSLAEETGIHPSHLSRILNLEPLDKHGKPHMELKGADIDVFERAVGNHIVRQFLMEQCDLRIVELVLAPRTA